MGQFDFLGRGFKIPRGLDDKGLIEMSEYEDDVREAIHIILNTAKGERLMHPDFGCGIKNYTFSVMSTATISLIKHTIREALVTWEPRIEVKEIELSRERLSEGILLIDIAYTIRKTNNMFNFVYPFYINEVQHDK